MFKGILFNKKDIHFYVMLLSAPLLLTLYRYHAYTKYFYQYFSALADNPQADIYARYWQFIIFFLLMFVSPVVYVKFVMKKPLSGFGLRLGDIKYGSKWLITIPLVVVPLMFLSSQMPDIRAEYPLAKADTPSKYMNLAYLIFLCKYIKVFIKVQLK